MGAVSFLFTAMIALGVLHAGLVLDGAGDAQGDVHLRVHRLARLAHLVVRAQPAGVDGGTGAADDAAQHLSQLFSQLDAALDILADAAANGHDVVRADQVHQLLRGLHDLHHLGVQIALAQLERRLHDLHRGGLRLVIRVLLHNTRTHRRHAGTEPRADDGRHQVAAEGRTGHLQVPVLHVPLLAVHVQRGGLPQELDVVGHIHVQVGAVSAQTGVQTGPRSGGPGHGRCSSRRSGTPRA